MAGETVEILVSHGGTKIHTVRTELVSSFGLDNRNKWKVALGSGGQSGQLY